MEERTQQELSLTELGQRSGVVRVEHAANSSTSNARQIPYAERYRQSNAVLETPAQRLQRAAIEEAARSRDDAA